MHFEPLSLIHAGCSTVFERNPSYAECRRWCKALSIGYPAVRSKHIRGVEISIAPPREQQRIADRMDAVLAHVHACGDCLDRVPAKSDAGTIVTEDLKTLRGR